MNFTKTADTNRTSLKGEFRATYAQLVEVFGQPEIGPNADIDGKVTCEWTFKFEDDSVASIYDWKEGETPMGEYSWHVGGHSFNAYMNVTDVFEQHFAAKI